MTWIQLGGTWFVVEKICAVYDDPDGVSDKRCAVWCGDVRRMVHGMTAEEVVDDCMQARRANGL